MSEKELFDQLFNIPSSPAPKEDPNDLLSSLLAAPLPKPRAQEKKRKQNDEDVHEYLRLAEKSNDKAKKSVQKWKQEQTLTPDEIRRKRQFEKVNAQFEKTKKESSLVPAPTSNSSTPKKQFMPNIIDPFHKPEKNKPKPQTPTTYPNSKEQKPNKMLNEKMKEREREKSDREEREARQEKERLAKVEAKLEKIKRKEMELAAERQQKEKLLQQQKAAAAAAAVKSSQTQQRTLAKQHNPAKQTRKKESSSSSSQSGSSSGSSSESQSSEKYDWRKELRSITKYNPNDQKFKKRDKCRIQQSGVDRIFGQDRHSYREGKREEQRDLQMQMQMKKRRMEKKNKHHKHHH